MRFLFAIFLLAASHVVAQTDTLNRINTEGEKFGYWKITCAMEQMPCDSPAHILEEGTYKDGVKHGVWIEYHSNGKVKSTKTYKRGKVNGPVKEYYENGKRFMEGNKKDYRWIGEVRSYYSNDTIENIAHFDSIGAVTGTRTQYWPNGKLMLHDDRNNKSGLGVYREYYENGLVMFEMFYANGKLNVSRTKRFPENAPTLPSQDLRPKDRSCNDCRSCTCREGLIAEGRDNVADVNGVIIRIDIYRDGKYAGSVAVE